MVLIQRGSVRQSTRLLGPAFVAAVAYVDPGNVATNTAAGAAYGYLLLWVLVAATLMAGLVQYLSAKVGWLTGRSLPELVADGETGHLVEPGDVAALRDRLALVLGDPAAAHRLGETARARAVERFTWEACARRCLAIYEALIGPR